MMCVNLRPTFPPCLLMRQVGSLESEEQAQRLADYLLVQGIETRVDRGEDGWLLWGLDDDLLERAKEELRAFEASPDDPKYQQSQGEAQQIRKEQEKSEKRARKNIIRVQPLQYGNFLQSPRPVTIGLVVISVLVALVTRLGDNLVPFGLMLVINTTFLRNGPAIFTDIGKGEIWRLVTPIFLHFSILHLLFNMMWLLELGTLIETRRGSARFVLFVLVTAVVSNLGQYWWTGLPMFGGMSGVVYAMFGYVWMKSRYDPTSGMLMPQSTVTIMIGWLFLCMTGMIGSIANTAHVVGLLAGMAIGYAPVIWDQRFG